MKFKTTRKAIMANYGTVIEVDYCELQNLLKYKSPVAYTAGVYGWNADIYEFGGVAIVTGYRPFGNIRLNREIMDKYEKEAENIYNNYRYDDRIPALEELQKKFIEEVLKNGKN